MAYRDDGSVKEYTDKTEYEKARSAYWDKFWPAFEAARKREYEERYNSYQNQGIPEGEARQRTNHELRMQERIDGNNAMAFDWGAQFWRSFTSKTPMPILVDTAKPATKAPADTAKPATKAPADTAKPIYRNEDLEIERLSRMADRLNNHLYYKGTRGTTTFGTQVGPADNATQYSMPKVETEDMRQQGVNRELRALTNRLEREGQNYSRQRRRQLNADKSQWDELDKSRLWYSGVTVPRGVWDSIDKEKETYLRHELAKHILEDIEKERMHYAGVDIPDEAWDKTGKRRTEYERVTIPRQVSTLISSVQDPALRNILAQVLGGPGMQLSGPASLAFQRMIRDWAGGY